MDQILKAVYYCRVSTDDENQVTSIINQKEESINIIKENYILFKKCKHPQEGGKT